MGTGRNRVILHGLENASQVRRDAIHVKFLRRIGDDDSIFGESALDLRTDAVADVARQAWLGHERIKREEQG
jgi:hypothetical protein